MDKIQIIEKLFYDIVTSSYILLPLAFLISKAKRKDIVPFFIAIYGVLFFGLLFAHGYLPKGTVRKIYQSVYTYAEYLSLAFIFWLTLKNSKVKWFMVILSGCFLIFQIIYFFSTKPIRLDSIPIGIETILLFVYIVYFFYESSQKSGPHAIYNHYCFWISIGVLVYLGGSFFFYILFNYLTEDEITAFGNLTFLAEVIKNILFALAIFIYARYPFEGSKKDSESVPLLDMI